MGTYSDDPARQHFARSDPLERLWSGLWCWWIVKESYQDSTIALRFTNQSSGKCV